MTISRTQTYDLLVCDGQNTVFPVSINFQEDGTMLSVSLVDSSNNINTLTLGTDYTVSNRTVHLLFTPESQHYILITFKSNYLQLESFLSNHPIKGSSFMKILDKTALEFQSDVSDLSRSIIIPLAGNYEAPFHDIAAQNSDDVRITGGSIVNIEDLEIASGGLNSSNISDARSSLQLGTMSLQNSDTVDITGGTIGGLALDIVGLTEISPNLNNDFIYTYDATDSNTPKKVKLTHLTPAPGYELLNDLHPALGADLDNNTHSIIFPSSTISDTAIDFTTNLDTKLVSQKAVKTRTDTAFGIKGFSLNWPQSASSGSDVSGGGGTQPFGVAGIQEASNRTMDFGGVNYYRTPINCTLTTVNYWFCNQDVTSGHSQTVSILCSGDTVTLLLNLSVPPASTVTGSITTSIAFTAGNPIDIKIELASSSSSGYLAAKLVTFYTI